jgi:hypothetical protein
MNSAIATGVEDAHHGVPPRFCSESAVVVEKDGLGVDLTIRAEGNPERVPRSESPLGSNNHSSNLVTRDFVEDSFEQRPRRVDVGELLEFPVDGEGIALCSPVVWIRGVVAVQLAVCARREEVGTWLEVQEVSGCSEDSWVKFDFLEIMVNRAGLVESLVDEDSFGWTAQSSEMSLEDRRATLEGRRNNGVVVLVRARR